MKVKLVKDHDIYGKAGDTVEVHEGRAKYLHSVGVIKLSEKTAAKVDEKEEKAAKNTKEEKTSKETK
jgi:ribosomal protein L9